jgi:peptidyl-tRNA hydrolase
MSKLVFNRDGGKTDEFGHLIGLMRFMQGEVIEGLQVAANGAPNMSVNVPYGIAAIPTGSGATGYRYFVGLDATENVTIPTANASNPRNDLIVLWVDKAITPSQAFTNNSNGMLNISVVSGAPASTPADPSVAAIQAAIGAANPYIVLARVVTGAGVTQINSGNITDLRSLTSVNRLLSSQIITAYLADLSVTTGKIADLAVTTGKLAGSAATAPKVGLAAAMTVKTQGATTSNFGGGNNLLLSWNDVVIPAGCTKALVIGRARIQGQNANIQDMSLWADFGSDLTNGQTLQTLQSGTFTSVNSFNGGHVQQIGVIDVTAGTHTLRIYGSASLANMSQGQWIVIPMGS